MSTAFFESYFVDGGTLRANTPSYVKRPADNELFDALMNREFCYILTPRQMGKSSLMIQTSRRLQEKNVKTAVVDIQGIGTTKIREWYASLLSQIRRGLKLSVDIDGWMQQKSNIGFGQLFVDFIQDVVLSEISEQVVIFLDEVDWMIKIDFRDDFFASIRSIYNARAQYSEFNRVSFVLLGVASPADLISEPTRTPFNIGHAIPLQELSLQDATPLEDGLEQVCPGEGNRILKRIFFWTNGHPYLTQKICKSIAETGKSDWSDSDVDKLVDKLFLSDESRKEANLKFIQDRILSNEQYVELLKLYKRVRKSKIKENGQSVIQNQLMLSGMLTSRGGYLEIRNRIYHTVFNDRWISQNTPKNWQRLAIVIFGIIIVFFMSILIYDFTVGMRLNTYTVDFYASDSPAQRLNKLADIYRLKGVLSHTDSGLSASQLFYGLQREQQLAIFKDNFIDGNTTLQDDLVVVVSHLYITVADVDPENNNTELLQAMGDSLNKVETDPEIEALKDEITSWLGGRQSYRNVNYELALENYGNAISLNPQNPATVYERALVYIALEEYQSALKDLDTTISLAKESTQQDEIDLTPTVTATINIPSTDTPGVSTGTPTKSDVKTPTVSSTSIPGNTPSLDFTKPSPQPLLPTVIPTMPTYERFESNFSTFIEIVNAVRTLIDNTLGLQSALQINGDVSYANLQSVGLVKSSPTPQPPSGLLGDILERGYILVASDPNYEPQSFLNTEGVRPADSKCPSDALTTAEMQGFDVDVAIAVGDALGVETCFATPNWDVITAGKWADKWDVSIGSMTISTERQKVLDFSIPYYYIPAVIAVPADSDYTSIDDLAGMALCAGASTTYEVWLSQGDLGLPESSIYAQPPADITVVPLDTDQECAQALAAGREDFAGYVTSHVVVNANIAAGLPVKQLGSPVFSEDLAAAVDKSSSLSTESLLAEVDKIITQLHSDGTLSELSFKWFESDLTQAPSSNVNPTPSPIVAFAIPKPTSTLTSTTVEYVVQAGDTLSIIALKYGVTVDALMEANNITNPNILQLGQILIIPVAAGYERISPTKIITDNFNFSVEVSGTLSPQILQIVVDLREIPGELSDLMSSIIESVDISNTSVPLNLSQAPGGGGGGGDSYSATYNYYLGSSLELGKEIEVVVLVTFGDKIGISSGAPFVLDLIVEGDTSQ